MAEIEVTQEMLDAGNAEVQKVATDQGLSFALKVFSQKFIDTILIEGFRGMYNAMPKEK